MSRRVATLLIAALVASAAGIAALASPATASINATNATLNAAQSFFTWVAEGETFAASFAKSRNISSARGSAIITVVRPDSTEWSCTDIGTSSPVGTSCAFEEAATTAGVYEVRLIGSDPATPEYFATTLTWSIEAREADATVIPGRTWSEDFRMRNENTAFVPDLSMWVQTEQGYTYALTLRELHGINSRYNFDAFGVVDTSTCISVQHSAAFTPNDFPDIRNIVDSSCPFSPYKIFFEPPASDLPLAVTLPSGEETWMIQPVLDPTITGLSFTGTTPTARSGIIDFSVSNFEGTALLQIDADGDGVFGGPADREEPISVTATGLLSFPFDGLDGLGQPISESVNMSVRVLIDSVAEVHFTLDDIELLEGGIEVTRLNGPAGNESRLFWNDTPLLDVAFDSQALIKCSTTPVLESLAGTDSTGGVHGWGFGDCANVGELNTEPSNTLNGGGWGNNRQIDNWVLVDANAEATISVPAVVVPPVDPETPVDPGTPVDPENPTTPISPPDAGDKNTGNTGALAQTGLSSLPLLLGSAAAAALLCLVGVLVLRRARRDIG